jgi:hypothetical protein
MPFPQNFLGIDEAIKKLAPQNPRRGVALAYAFDVRGERRTAIGVPMRRGWLLEYPALLPIPGRACSSCPQFTYSAG